MLGQRVKNSRMFNELNPGQTHYKGKPTSNKVEEVLYILLSHVMSMKRRKKQWKYPIRLSIIPERRGVEVVIGGAWLGFVLAQGENFLINSCVGSIN